MLSAAPLRAAAATLAELRAREFSRLDRSGQVYADYTGSALYGDSQLDAHHELLRSSLFGNPHSEHRPSRLATETIDQARGLVLRFLDADASTHAVIFTANTTAAIKLVAESYPFTKQTACILSVDNHNSVNGIREYARRAGARLRAVPLDEQLRLRDAQVILDESRGGGLFAFPAQSNFSGALHPLPLVADAKAMGYDVLVDIASFAASHPFSLRECPADFVALSFYKLFGYPTGIGALVAKRDALARLRRPWFAGGTVSFASVQADAHQLRPGHEGFEDGTANFLGIAALAPGFALLEEAGMHRLSEHVARLTSRFLAGLPDRVRVYGPKDPRERGGTVAFNVLDEAGAIIPYWLIESAATRAGIALRGGCFCNPGAAETALALDPARTAVCLTELESAFTPERFAACSGTAVGAVRVSFGLANDERDVERVIGFVRQVDG